MNFLFSVLHASTFYIFIKSRYGSTSFLVTGSICLFAGGYEFKKGLLYLWIKVFPDLIADIR